MKRIAFLFLLFCGVLLIKEVSANTSLVNTKNNVTICIYSNRIESFPSNTLLLAKDSTLNFYVYLFQDSCVTNPVIDAIVFGWITNPSYAVTTLTYTNESNGLYKSNNYTLSEGGYYNLTVWARSPTIGNISVTSLIYATTPSTISAGGGGGGTFGAPIAFDIFNITIRNITPTSLNISFKLTNKGYTSPITINVKQRLMRLTTLISPTEMEMHSKTEIIALDYMKTVNSTFTWFGSLPDGIYKIEISGYSVSDSRVTSVATFLFNYTNGGYVAENQTVYSFTPTPSIADIINDPNIKTVFSVAGIGIGGVFCVVLTREWVFKKRKKTAEQMRH